MTSPRVILFSTTQGAGSGAERVLEHLLGARSSMVALVIAPPRSSVETVAKNLGLPTLSWDAPRNSSAGNLLARLRFPISRAREFGGTLFHAWHTRGFEWGVSLARHLTLPLVGTLHDDLTSRQNSAVRRYLLRASAHRMGSLAVVSQAVENLCLTEGWKVPLAVIRNGLPDEERAPSIKTNGPIRIGFLGLNERWKGIETTAKLVEAFAHQPVEWDFFGSPSPEVEARVRQIRARFPGKVHFHGRQPTAEIYSRVDVVLHPSLAFDPYPTVLLEAARAGIPVVASASGGAPEIVVSGTTGLLYAPSDAEAARTALKTLVDDPPLRLKMGRAARERYCRHFQIANMVAAYEEFWTRALCSPANRP